jgi:Ca-activated chloride channel family protein
VTGTFLVPAAWPLVLLVPAAWLALRLVDRARAARTADVVGPRLAALVPGLSEGRRAARRLLVAAGLLFALLAAMQPVWGESVGAAERRGADVVVCLDVSRSMLARDAAPTRLGAAQAALKELAKRAKGDRLGLVVFAGEARLLVPLTKDMRSFAALAATADPASVTRGGTDLGAALDAALGALDPASGAPSLIVLVTDGEDLGGRGLAAAQRCAARHVTVHTAGIGTPLGSKIAVPTPRGETFVADRTGADVVSTMDVAGLRRIAEAARGEFVDASGGAPSLASLYDRRIEPLAREAFADEERRERPNRFQWPLMAAFLVWILDLCLTDRRKR